MRKRTSGSIPPLRDPALLLSAALPCTPTYGVSLRSTKSWTSRATDIRSLCNDMLMTLETVSRPFSVASEASTAAATRFCMDCKPSSKPCLSRFRLPSRLSRSVRNSRHADSTCLAVEATACSTSATVACVSWTNFWMPCCFSWRSLISLLKPKRTSCMRFAVKAAMRLEIRLLSFLESRPILSILCLSSDSPAERSASCLLKSASVLMTSFICTSNLRSSARSLRAWMSCWFAFLICMSKRLRLGGEMS
mmetsp:Transcript_110323/g.356090  ORF Transcript_110323/g.356090 Transcript_110323/m.356090 type:complete len:250 (-) Transcript_110323:617-1366(-)